MTSRYVDTADAAKLIRKHLKVTFPGVKFGVRISRYSGGSSIGINWTDGPTVAQIETSTHAFRGKRFEGMTDCSYGASSWYCGEHGARVAETYGCDISSNNGVHASRCCAEAELVHFGSDYVNGSRALSAEFEAELLGKVLADAGLPADTDPMTPLPDHSQWARGDFEYVCHGVRRLADETTR